MESVGLRRRGNRGVVSMQKPIMASPSKVWRESNSPFKSQTKDDKAAGEERKVFGELTNSWNFISTNKAGDLGMETFKRFLEKKNTSSGPNTKVKTTPENPAPYALEDLDDHQAAESPWSLKMNMPLWPLNMTLALSVKENQESEEDFSEGLRDSECHGEETSHFEYSSAQHINFRDPIQTHQGTMAKTTTLANQTMGMSLSESSPYKDMDERHSEGEAVTLLPIETENVDEGTKLDDRQNFIIAENTLSLFAAPQEQPDKEKDDVDNDNSAVIAKEATEVKENNDEYASSEKSETIHIEEEVLDKIPQQVQCRRESFLNPLMSNFTPIRAVPPKSEESAVAASQEESSNLQEEVEDSKVQDDIGRNRKVTLIQRKFRHSNFKRLMQSMMKVRLEMNHLKASSIEASQDIEEFNLEYKEYIDKIVTRKFQLSMLEKLNQFSAALECRNQAIRDSNEKAMKYQRAYERHLKSEKAAITIQSSWRKYTFNKRAIKKQNARKEDIKTAKILTSMKENVSNSSKVKQSDVNEDKYFEESKVLREELKKLKEEVQMLRTKVSDNKVPAQRGRSTSRSNRKRNYRSFSAARNPEVDVEQSAKPVKSKSRSLSRNRNNRRQRRNSFSAPENKENREQMGNKEQGKGKKQQATSNKRGGSSLMRGDTSPLCPPPGLGFAPESLLQTSAIMNKHHRKAGKRFNGP